MWPSRSSLAIVLLVAVALLVVGAGSPPAVAADTPFANGQPAGARLDVPLRLIGETFHSDGSVFVGPDRFPYVAGIQTPSADDPSATRLTMVQLAQLALAKHAGIAIYEHARTESSVWVFSLGSVALLAQGKWQNYDPNPAPTPGPGDHVLTGTPSLEILPPELRLAVAEYMRTNDHVESPKIVLIIIRQESGQVRQPFMMAPNLPSTMFPTQASWYEELHRIEWFIPPTVDAVRPPVSPEAFEFWFRVVKPL
ncbi:MAG: hypothetical protein ABSD03_06885 [Vulcanimicrobiaceae bacterium]|jgi:hypothetical protein